MHLRWQEVVVALAVVFGLVVLKHIPATAHLPLARTAGVVCFSYAIFLALRLVQSESAVDAGDGWRELRASPVEMFGAFAAGLVSGLLLAAVIVNGDATHVPFSQLALGMALSILLALAAGAIAFLSVLVRVRWNRSVLEHRSGFGKLTRLSWNDVRGVRHGWRGVTVWTASQHVSFSPFHSGASQLIKDAAERARRNASTAAKTFAPL